MAKAKSKAIPAKRGTKRGRTHKAPVPETAAALEESTPAPQVQYAKVVDITPENRGLPGYREVEVISKRTGHYGLKRRVPNEAFTMALVGEGDLPDWVKPVTELGSDAAQ